MAEVMPEVVAVEVADEAAMLAFGRRLAAALPAGSCVHLEGQLGAGKTTLCRGVLRGLGHTGAVKSPTYTLVEPYELEGHSVFHVDLYRLADPAELDYIGIRDYFDSGAICLVEWPERGAGFLPPADLVVRIDVDGGGRLLALAAATAAGRRTVERLGGV